MALLAAFTPHARGSTQLLNRYKRIEMVYPACAGIDPVRLTLSFDFHRLPRMRGDRPHEWDDDGEKIPFTPHARGSTCG